MADRYDVAVIGSGPGGYVAAIRAAQLGKKVALIEKEVALGGTCLRVGCIPSKALLESSELFYKANKEFKVHGIAVTPTLDLAAMMKRKDGIVRQLTNGVAGLMKKNKVDVIKGEAAFASPDAIQVGEQTVEADHFIVATGSVPTSLPGIAIDGDRIVDSTGALAFDRVPGSLVVIGGGYIGLEMASVWSRLGAKVTVLEFLPEILPGMDAELAKTAHKLLSRRGMEIVCGAKVTGASVTKKSVEVTAEVGGETQSYAADKVLVAVGRKPNTGGLALDKAGIELDGKGRIQVDERLRTTRNHIYAIGDVVAGPMLAHKASEDGVAAAEFIAGRKGSVSWDLVPGVCYTDPEIATVGRSEESLKEAGIAYATGTFPFMANGRAKALNARDGFAKVLADEKTGKVLGVHIIGPRAGDLIAEAVTAMAFSGSAEDIGITIHAHPTLAETLKEAALAAGGEAIHI